MLTFKRRVYHDPENHSHRRRKNAMAVVPVSPPATREPSALSTAKPSCCGTITATALATVCPAAPPVPLHSPSGRPLPTMSRLCWKTSRKKAAAAQEAPAQPAASAFHGCPGSRMHQFHREEAAAPAAAAPGNQPSQLAQWPLPDQAGACERPPTLQGPSFWWRQTARRMPMPMSIRSSCGAK